MANAQGYDYLLLGSLAVQFVNGQLEMPNQNIRYIQEPRAIKYTMCVRWVGTLSPDFIREIQCALPLFTGYISSKIVEGMIIVHFSDEIGSRDAARFFNGFIYKSVEFSALKSETFADEPNIDTGSDEIEAVSFD